jgi:methyl-accepting chemotaxis protein
MNSYYSIEDGILYVISKGFFIKLYVIISSRIRGEIVMNLLANLKIGQKIYLVLALVSLIAIGIGVVGLIGINSANRSLQTVYEDRVVCLKQLKGIADMYSVNIVDTCHKVRNGNISWPDGVNNIDIAEKEIHKQWTDYMSTYLVQEEAKLAKEAESLMKIADASVTKAKVFMERQDKEALTNYTIRELYQDIDPISDKISALVNLQLEVAKQEYGEAQKRYGMLRNIFVTVLAGGIVIALSAAFFIIRMITQPLKAMLEDVKEVAGGNLAIQAVEVKSEDEVGQMGIAFNAMLVQLRELVKQVSQSAEQVAASSEELTASSEQSAQANSQIAASISDVANGAAEQLAASGETSAVVEQMSAGIQQIAANTN